MTPWLHVIASNYSYIYLTALSKSNIFLLIRDIVVKRWNRLFGCQTVYCNEFVTKVLPDNDHF